MSSTSKLNFVLLLSYFLVNISTANIDKVVSMQFSQRWSNADKHTWTQLSFSTKFQRWYNVGSSTLNRRNSVDVVSTLFCQRWSNVDKCKPAQLSFSTKYQCWCVFWVYPLPPLITPFPVNRFPNIELPRVSNNIPRFQHSCFLISCFTVSLTRSIYDTWTLLMIF